VAELKRRTAKVTWRQKNQQAVVSILGMPVCEQTPSQLPGAWVNCGTAAAVAYAS